MEIVKMKDAELIKLIAVALKEPHQDGLHIAIGDGNLDDEDIKWILTDECKLLTERGKTIGEQLLIRTRKERYKVNGKADELAYGKPVPKHYDVEIVVSRREVGVEAFSEEEAKLKVLDSLRKNTYSSDCRFTVKEIK